MDDQTSFDILDHETTDAGDEEHEISWPSSVSSVSSLIDDQTCSETPDCGNPDTVEVRDEISWPSSVSSVSSLIDDQICSETPDCGNPDTVEVRDEISWPSSVSSVSSLIDDQICSETPDCGNPDTVEVRDEISWQSSVSSVSSLIDDQIRSETPDCGNPDTVEVRSEISWPSYVSSVSSLIDDQICSETPDCGNPDTVEVRGEISWPSLVSSPDCGNPFKPGEEGDGHGNENQRKPADPERTDPKTLAETSLTGFTSRSRDPDRTHPKGVVLDNNSDSGIEDSRDGESRQNRYNLQLDPDITVPKLVIQVDELNHNIAISRHLTLRKNSCDAGLTNVPGRGSSTESSQCDQNPFKPGEEGDGHGNENQRKPADPERTDPKTLAETSLTGFTSRSRDPDRTHPKGVVLDNNSDSGIEDSRDGESRQNRYNLQLDPDITVPKLVIQVDELNHNIAISRHLTLRKDSCDAGLTNVPGLDSSTESSQCDQNTFKPCEEEDGHRNENQRKPADPERTDPKTLAETSLTGFTSRSRDPDRTHPKGVVHDNNSDSGIEDSRDGESRQNRYNLQQDPDNTVPKVVIQADELNHNIATSQHLTLKKDPKVAEQDHTYSKTIISVKDFDSGLEDSLQRQHVYLNNPDETHPKVVTGDCDSESMSEVNTSEKETIEPHRTSAKQDQTWVDGLTTEKTTGSFIYNYLIDQPVSYGLEANRCSYINTFKGEDREILKQNENCLQDPDNTRPKSVIPVQHDNENCQCLIPVCTDPKETIPKAAIQDLLSEGESDSEDIACTTESLSPVLPQPDPSTITSGHSATDSGITTYTVLNMTDRIVEMCSLHRQAYESRNTRCNDKHALEQTEDLLQNLQKTLPSLSHRYLSTMLKNLALSDTIEAALPSSSLRYLSTILKNLTLADTIEAFDLRQRMQLLTEAIGSEFGRNTVQGSHRRGLGTEEGRPDVAEDSRPGVAETPVPSRSQNDEGYILDMKQVSDRDSATHRSYFDEKENDVHLLNPDIKTGSQGKSWFDAENDIPSMNDLSGKAKDVADKSKTKYVSEKLSRETDPSNVITTEGPDSKLDPSVDSNKGRIRELKHPYESAPAQQPHSQSLEQESIQSHNQGQNTSPLPQTQGRPDLSFGKELLQLDGSDATLGREQTADVPGPPQEQDTVYQRYSLPAKLQDYYYERSTAEEMSESEQTGDDTHPQHSDQEFTHPHGHDSYQIPTKLQEHDASERSLDDSYQIPTKLQEHDASERSLDDSYQIPTKLQEHDASERSLDSGHEEITDIPQIPSVSAPMPYFWEDLFTNLTDKVSQQHGSSQSTQLDPPVQPSTEVESDLPRTNMSEPVNFKELFSGVPAIDHAQDSRRAQSYPADVPTPDNPFYNAADLSGHTDASGPGPGTGDDASSKSKDFKQHHKEELKTTKIIYNDLEISEVRGTQRYINEEPQDRTHRQRYNEGLSWDPERQDILDNRSVSGSNRDTTRNYQFEVYLRDGKDLIQESKLRTFVIPASIEEVSHGGEEEGGKEDEDEGDIEEKVKQNEEL
ncbi:uncharacterized protein LOC124119936 isoform X2 [Haliotis rufescens]|uniref:uncharacterized protein LOC124119936 isoform X2 n=1 Tax=Haliotis rufescens TaxID=6454 RepID=UPI00201F463D|nr:uncharacterized protein LOC124119936 isoform X2 [Haliotis rufescens]